MQVDVHTYELVKRRAAYPILLKYRVNRYELWLLCQMAGFLRHKGKPIVSKAIFMKTVTGNYMEKRKMGGYYNGLLSKKLIGAFEWVGKAGSECFGISELGAHVLREYEVQLQLLIVKLDVKEIALNTCDVEQLGGRTFYRKSA